MVATYYNEHLSRKTHFHITGGYQVENFQRVEGGMMNWTYEGRGSSLCIPECIVQNFRFVFAWFGSNILILVTNLSTYFNPATTFLLFSQSFVDLTTYTNSLVFVPLPCEISVSFFTPFSTKFPFDFFIVLGLQDCARQKVSGLLFIFTTAITLSAYSII